ncbi:hypothetical protein M0R45_006685 [Rubus argutus]|uniref:Uncharacterized protein n=1 Tax=Rubus argutus TaxID=59490 RepID=A0AAW1YR97_RUBAR
MPVISSSPSPSHPVAVFSEHRTKQQLRHRRHCHLTVKPMSPGPRPASCSTTKPRRSPKPPALSSISAPRSATKPLHPRAQSVQSPQYHRCCLPAVDSPAPIFPCPAQIPCPLPILQVVVPSACNNCPAATAYTSAVIFCPRRRRCCRAVVVLCP